MIKGIRKSLKDKSKSNHSSISSPITNDRTTSISSVQDIKINPTNLLQSPKKVIKALYDYTPQGPGELAFSKGDFFHVIGNENDKEWYEACNPSKDLRGMVPVPYFEVFGKTRPNTDSSNNTSPISRKKLSTDSVSNSFISSRSSSQTGSANNALYAIVLYDFKAERSDELDVNIGENIILCAHHNYEWFIAKPINRLGGPGLVPVSYVSIINILTGQSTGNDVVDDINVANLPTVEEWKNKNAKYKASSIPLGDVDENETTQDFRNSRIASNSTTRLRSTSNNYQQQQQHQHNDQTDLLINNEVFVIDASVDSFHVDNGRYWFHVQVVFNTGEVRSLCRYYEDFYDFQIRLLELFPNEAGRSNEHKRILPFIPGPLTYVTDKITNKRQIDLNEYVKELINLPDYISHSRYINSLFELKHELDQVIERSNYNNNGNHYDAGETTLIKEESVQTLNQGTIIINPEVTSVKLKFYYKDDIFALLIPQDISLEDLKTKIKQRIYDEDDFKDFKLFVKDDEEKEILTSADISNVLNKKLKILIDDEF